MRVVEAIGVVVDVERGDALVQAKPLVTGWSSSGAACTSTPSSTVATSPHAGSQTRQKVLTSIPRRSPTHRP